jgi:TPR repeat protein
MGAEVRESKGMVRSLAFSVLTLLLSVSMVVTAHSEPFEDALDAYLRGDYREASRLFKTMAEQGDADAQFNLGFQYFHGQGVPQDYAEAVKWYRRAAEQGKAAAQSNLGFLYNVGQGVPQDYAEAAKWYQRVAAQGDADAQLNLGFLYFHGQGVPQDHILAHMSFDLAASWFPAAEKKRRERAVRNRDRVASEMTPEQIAEAQRLASEWIPKEEAR